MLKQRSNRKCLAPLSRLSHPNTLSPSQHFLETLSWETIKFLCFLASLPSLSQNFICFLFFLHKYGGFPTHPTPIPFPGLLPIHFSHLFQSLWLLRLLMWAPKSSTFLSPRTLYLIVVKLPSVANLPFHL